MNYVKVDPLAAQPLAGQGRAAPLIKGSILGAAFRQENEMVNLAMALARPVFPVDPKFDVLGAVQKSPYQGDYGERLFRAQSQPEFDFISQTIAQELRDKQLFAQHPVQGFMAAALAGAISPTSLIPLVGPARGLKGLAQSFALAGSAVTAQEATLFGLQETRTPLETGISIASGTVLGGILGGLGRQLSPAVRQGMASDMADTRGITTIPITDPITGATKKISFATIKKVELPEFNPETAAVGQRITAYTSEDVPVEATITHFTPGEVVVKKLDGATTKLDEGELSSAPRDPENSSPIVSHEFRTADEILNEPHGPDIPFDRQPLVVVQAADRNNLLTPGTRHWAADFPNGVKVIFQRRGDGYSISLLDERGAIRALPEGNTTVGAKTVAELKQKFASGELDGKVAELKQAADKADGILPVSPKADNFDTGVGAGQTRTPVPGKLFHHDRFTGKIVDYLATWNPLTRLKNSNFKAARSFGNMAGSSGTRSAGATEGIAAASGGFLQAKVRVHIAMTAQQLELDLATAYYSYIKNGAKLPNELRMPFMFDLRNTILSPVDGKMAPQEFREAVTDAYATGTAHAIPQINEAAKAVEDKINYFRAEIERAQEYRSNLTGENEVFVNLDAALGEGLKNFFHQVYNTAAISKNRGDFTNDFAPHFARRKEMQFSDAYNEFNSGREEALRYQELLQLPQKELNSTYARADNALKSFAADKEYIDGQNYLASLRKGLRDQGLDPKAIAKASRAAEKEMPRTYKELSRQVKNAKQEKKFLEQIGAQLDEKQAKLVNDINDLEDAQVDLFTKEAKAAVKLDAKLTKLGDAPHDAEVNSLWAKFTDAVRLSSAARRKLADKELLADPTKFDTAVDKLNNIEERTAALFKELEKAETFSPEEARLALQEAAAIRQVRAAELNAKRAVRAAKLEESLKKLDTEGNKLWKQQELDKSRKDFQAAEDAFAQHWHSRGGEGRIIDGSADFTKSATDEVNALYHNLVGSHARIGGMDLLGDIRGAEKTRSLLFIPYGVKKKWLVRDAAHVMQAYAHHIAPDLELWRATGSVNGKDVITQITQEADILSERLNNSTHTLHGEPVNKAGVEPKDYGKLVEITPKIRQKLELKLQNNLRAAIEDTRVIVDRLRFQHGRPQNPDSIFYRMGNTVKDANVSLYMGGAAISNIGDLGATVVHFGLGKMIHGGMARIMMDTKSTKLLKREAFSAHLGLQTFAHGNRSQLFGLSSELELRKSILERGTHEIAKRMSVVNLLALVTDTTEMVTAVSAYTDISRALAAVSRGARDKDYSWARALFARNGVNEDMARRMWAQYQIPGGSTKLQDGLLLPNGAAWGDGDAALAMRALMHTMVDNAVFNGGLDVPTWTTGSMLGKMLGQFKSYQFMAVNRMLIHGLQEQDMAFMSGTMVSLALGALAYYTYAIAAGGAVQDRMENATPLQWTYEAMNRSFLFTASTDIQRIGEAIPALNDLWFFGGGQGRSSRAAGSVWGAVGGPSYTTLSRAFEVLQGINDPTASTMHKARQLIAYNQVFWFRRVADMMENAAVNTIGLPDRRN